MLDFWKGVGRTFVLVTTGALLSMSLIMTFFAREELFHVWNLWGILFIGLLSGLANVVFLSKREPSATSMLVRKIVHFFLILTIVLGFALLLGWIEAGAPARTVFFVGMFVAIYLVVIFLEHRKDRETAILINQRLRDYQNRSSLTEHDG